MAGQHGGLVEGDRGTMRGPDVSASRNSFLRKIFPGQQMRHLNISKLGG
jgi:hypothetical protein